MKYQTRTRSPSKEKKNQNIIESSLKINKCEIQRDTNHANTILCAIFLDLDSDLFKKKSVI